MASKMPIMDKETEQMLLDVALESVEDGVEDFTKPEVFFGGDEELPAKMVVSRTQGDTIDVYHTQTGQRSTILKYMLRNQMQKVLPDGSRAFSLNPTKQVKTGKIKCWFHPEAPYAMRQTLEKLGLDHIICPKANIRSQFDLTGHMKHRHKEEYAAILLDKEQAEKEEERLFLRAQMAALTGKPLLEEVTDEEYEIPKPKFKKRSPAVRDAMKMTDSEKKAWGEKMREARQRKQRERLSQGV